jgi:serine protease AprX
MPSKERGLMTSAVAAGNGWLSHGLYGGLASKARLELVKVRNEAGIGNTAIPPALNWSREHGPGLGVRVISLSGGTSARWEPVTWSR